MYQYFIYGGGRSKWGVAIIFLFHKESVNQIFIYDDDRRRELLFVFLEENVDVPVSFYDSDKKN